ncbi:MAG TPA: hypothetical protein VL633_06780, partial [Bacteroidota bacterium]|nr:hypothetical protein [Bacteroidota bacterium]
MKLIHSTKFFVAVLVLFVLGGMTQTNSQTKYRTFSQQSLSEKKGHPGKSLGSKVCFTFVNEEGFTRYNLKAIISAPIIAVLDSGGFTTITMDSKHRIIKAYGNNVAAGASATLCLLVQKKMAGTEANFWNWIGNDDLPTTPASYIKLDASSDIQFYTQPNGGNARDFIYKKVVTKPAGVVMGIPRPDSAKFYGWVRYKTADRYYFPHTDYGRCFDFIKMTNGTTKPFLKELKNPHVSKYNNHLLGEAHALKLAVIANDAHVTEPFDLVSTRLGDLIYNNPIDPADALNGMTIRQLLLKADSMFTFCGIYGPDEFMHCDTAISR